ncbi:hypothetical protein J4405_02765 [Candidatus Woesearchaeota archaeon]|nr:hypothetical protein [Candidatus Woesearchaeota archaeon]
MIELSNNQVFGQDDDDFEVDIDELKKILGEEKKAKKFLKQKRCYIAS